MWRQIEAINVYYGDVFLSALNAQNYIKRIKFYSLKLPYKHANINI
jgi:hypothetical protein